MKFKVLTLAVFAIGLGLFINSAIRKGARKSVEPRSFIIHYLLSQSEDGRPAEPTEYRVRHVSATGEWKETQYGFKGKVTTWGASRDGQYIVAQNVKQYYGTSDIEFTRTAWRSEAALKSCPQLVRTEYQLGLKSYVLRDDAGENEIETNFSPELGMTPLKQIVRTKADAKVTISLEPIGLEFRELSAGETQLPDLPIRFDVAERKSGHMRAAGMVERAQALELGMSKLKSDR